MSARSRGGRAAGFTLVEVLVVLLIVGIVATTLTISLNAVTGHDTQRELERLEIALDAAADRAQIRGVPIAVEFLPGSYRFTRYTTDGQWQTIDDDPLLALRTLNSELRWQQLQIEGAEQAQPWRLVFASLPPRFVLKLAGPVGEVVLRGGATGQIRRGLP